MPFSRNSGAAPNIIVLDRGRGLSRKSEIWDLVLEPPDVSCIASCCQTVRDSAIATIDSQ